MGCFGRPCAIGELTAARSLPMVRCALSLVAIAGPSAFAVDVPVAERASSAVEGELLPSSLTAMTLPSQSRPSSRMKAFMGGLRLTSLPFPMETPPFGRR